MCTEVGSRPNEVRVVTDSLIARNDSQRRLGDVCAKRLRINDVNKNPPLRRIFSFLRFLKYLSLSGLWVVFLQRKLCICKLFLILSRPDNVP